MKSVLDKIQSGEFTKQWIEEYKSGAKNFESMRANGIPTIPTLLKDELNTNPFLRADDISFAKTLDIGTNDPVAIFAETRSRKDNF